MKCCLFSKKNWPLIASAGHASRARPWSFTALWSGARQLGAWHFYSVRLRTPGHFADTMTSRPRVLGRPASSQTRRREAPSGKSAADHERICCGSYAPAAPGRFPGRRARSLSSSAGAAACAAARRGRTVLGLSRKEKNVIIGSVLVKNNLNLTKFIINNISIYIFKQNLL
jgi:hypothetical protein